MNNTNTHVAALAPRRELRHAVPVFRDEPLVLADTDRRPDLFPASDAFGRWVGNLVVETDAETGDDRPTHALRAVSLDAELAIEGIFRTDDGRLLAQFRIVTLGGAKVNVDAIVYQEVNPAAPIGVVWSELLKPAFTTEGAR
ncbi:MAG: hypothetical protein IJV65_08880 [Kiritimatiellae bacterium]|nr:hypothetical protein [Kiritimatiellia bacterium]